MFKLEIVQQMLREKTFTGDVDSNAIKNDQNEVFSRKSRLTPGQTEVLRVKPNLLEVGLLTRTFTQPGRV